MILVSGATGKVGREVVAQLVAAGEQVRALVRDPAKARFDAKVQLAVGDLSKPETLPKAVDGVQKLFSLATGPNLGALEGALAVAAKKAGVRHVVKLSVLGAGSGNPVTVSRWHEAGEKAYQDADLPWTFLRPGSFMANALNWVPTIKAQGKVFSSFSHGRFPPIHHKDIAAVAVKALTSAGHEGKAYSMTGPEALTMDEQVRQISEAVGKPIEYVAITDEMAKDGMLKSGMPAIYADALLQLASAVRDGKAGTVLPTVEQVTGRKALTFATWVQENVAAFR